MSVMQLLLAVDIVLVAITAIIFFFIIRASTKLAKTEAKTP